MKSRAACFVVGLFGGVVAFAALYVFLEMHTNRIVMQAEFKVVYDVFERAEDNAQMREYLKSRLYFLAYQLRRKDLSS